MGWSEPMHRLQRAFEREGVGRKRKQIQTSRKGFGLSTGKKKALTTGKSLSPGTGTKENAAALPTIFSARNVRLLETSQAPRPRLLGIFHVLLGR